MVLKEPRNYHVNLKYAEMLYSTKRDRLEDLINARKYFMHAALLREEGALPCVRALFGIIKATKAIKSLNAKQKDEHAAEIISSAQE